MALLKVENLSYTYSKGHPALSGVTFQIDPGEKAALIGLNGAGKSTLLNCLAGVYRPTGTVIVDGKLFSSASRKEIIEKIGLVFQDPNDQLFMPTVSADVAFGPINLGLSKEIVGKRVKEALALVGLSGFEDRLTYQMSFGEKKRAALACVLSMEPKLLLLDEPTSNLDPKRRREFIDTILSLKQAAIIATHDLALARLVCTRVLVLRDGVLIADGDISVLDDRCFIERIDLY